MFVGLPTREWPLHAPATEKTIHTVLSHFGGKLGVVASSPWIDLARTEVVAQFLASKEEEILWIDSDIAFDLTVVEAMRSAKADVITVSYRQRRPPHHFNVRTLRGEHPIEAPRRIVDGKRIIEIESDGLGCCLAQRGVIERLVQIHPELIYEADDGAPRSWLFQPFIHVDYDEKRLPAPDDKAFFLRVRAADFKVECLVDAVVLHSGVHSLLGDLFDD